MPQAVFEALQEVVDRLTGESVRSRPAEGGKEAAHRIQVAGWTLVYERNEPERTVTLVEISPDPAAPL